MLFLSKVTLRVIVFGLFPRLLKSLLNLLSPLLTFFVWFLFGFFDFSFFVGFTFSLSISLSPYPLFVGGVGRGRFGPPKLLNVAELF